MVTAVKHTKYKNLFDHTYLELRNTGSSCNTDVHQHELHM